MTINVCDLNLDLYKDILQLLRDVKLTQGPSAVTATLQRHKSIKRFLFDYQKENIKNLEDKMTLDY